MRDLTLSIAIFDHLASSACFEAATAALLVLPTIGTAESIIVSTHLEDPADVCIKGRRSAGIAVKVEDDECR